MSKSTRIPCWCVTVFLMTVVQILSSSIGAPQDGVDDWKPEKHGNVLESTLVRYYVFSMDNPDEFMNNGSIPILREIGPFTYREKRLKQNMRRLDDTTLEYDINWSMHFLPELTGKGLSEKTEFTNVNVPFVTMAEGLSIVGLPKAFNNLLMDEVVEAGEKLIRKGLNFGDSTFYGYNISLYTTILDDVTQGQTEERYPELANGKFAFFKNKNGTVTGTYTVQSTPSYPFGPILTFQGKSGLGFWPPSTHCDDVSGSLDFFTFPKNIKKKQDFDIFLPENCRSLKLKFVKEEIFREIPVYVYKFPLEQFQNNLESEDTSCHCLNFANVSDPKCLDAGFMDYSGCSKGAPLLGSFPHFLHANPRHLNNVKGLMPNKSLHESEIIIEPITGTPLYAVRRFQINLRMRPIPTVTQFENQTENIIPLAWFEHILDVPSTVFTDVKMKLEKLKEAESPTSDTDTDYQNDESPVEEVDDNALGDRFGFPGGSSDSKSNPQQKVIGSSSGSGSGNSATNNLSSPQKNLVGNSSASNLSSSSLIVALGVVCLNIFNNSRRRT